MIRFDGQVAIVTGAGGGMGRAYALLLASRGARVVVNDYGGDMFGHHAGAQPLADGVAAEISALGGKAVASSLAVGSAAAGREIAAAAFNAFGRVDILINNAGVSASGPLDAVSDERVENAYRVNVIGPHHLIRAVWPTMRAQRYGRILNISSNAALGMGATAAYAASKAGLLGLTLDAAQEGRSHGIHVNALMPTAYTRMIEAVPDPDFVAWMRERLPAEHVAAVAAYLVSGAATVTGHVFSTGGGRLARIAWCEAAGTLEAGISPEGAAERIERASDLSAARLVDSQQAEIELYMQAFPMADGRRVGSLSPDDFAARTGKKDV